MTISPCSGARAPPWAWPALGVVLVTALVYWPVLSLGFVWDDFGLYLMVPALRDGTSFWGGTLSTVLPGLHFFRPLALLTFKAQFLLFGGSPVAAHAISLALHALNTAVLTALAFRLADRDPVPRAAFAGLLYGLHPVLIEPVSWMSCRFDLLITLWLLLALYSDLSVRAAWARAAVVGALYFFALNCKEMAGPFPAVLSLFQLATRYRGGNWRESLPRLIRGEWASYVLLVLALAVYVALRSHFIGDTVDNDPDVVAALTGVPERLAFFAHTTLFHLRNAILPFAVLSPLHPVDLDALAFTTRDLLPIAAVALVLATLAWGVFRRQRSVTLLAAGVLALTPVLNLVPISIGRNLGHERYLTFPLALFVLALVVAPAPAGRFARTAKLAGALVGIAWLGASVANIRVTVPLWQSDVTLWSWALERTGSEYARYGLVTALLREERPEIAVRQVPPARGLDAYRGYTRLEIAKYMLGHARRDEAEALLRAALREFPDWQSVPPVTGREARDFETYRGHIGLAYAKLARLEREDGRTVEADNDERLAQFYSRGPTPP